MDYFYHYYNDCDHHSTFSPTIIDQCNCPSSTFLLSLNIMLLAILIYTFTMDKITVKVNSKLPFISVNENNLIPSTPGSNSTIREADSPTETLELLRLPSKSPSKSPSRSTSPISSSSKVTMLKQPTFDCYPSPSDSFYLHNEEKLINLESTALFNEPSMISPADSLNSFASSGSNRRKLIKPDFSLSFFDSSISSTSLPTDEESHLTKVKEESEDDSFNVLIHNGSEEDHY